MAEQPVLGFNYLEVGQAQKEVTINEAFNVISSAVQMTVLDKDAADPSLLSPNDGDAYIVPSGAVGDWSGQDLNIAIYYSGWSFIIPSEGWTVFVEDESSFRIYRDGTNSEWALLLAVTEAGEVGIGTGSPLARLDVRGLADSDSVALYVRGGDGPSTTGVLIDSDGESSDTILRMRSNTDPTAITDSDTRFLVTGDGNVLIGTTTGRDDTRMVVRGPDSFGTTALYAIAPNEGDATGILVDTDNESSDVGIRIRANDSGHTNSDTVWIVTGVGNAGIGTDQFGTDAENVLSIANGVAPTDSPSGVGQIYVESGDLKYRGPAGTVTTIASS
jgi:hypothetical protein